MTSKLDSHQGLKAEIINGNLELVAHNKYGDIIITCPACHEKGELNNGHWICGNDDCRVLRFFTQ